MVISNISFKLSINRALKTNTYMGESYWKTNQYLLNLISHYLDITVWQVLLIFLQFLGLASLGQPLCSWSDLHVLTILKKCPYFVNFIPFLQMFKPVLVLFYLKKYPTYFLKVKIESRQASLYQIFWLIHEFLKVALFTRQFFFGYSQTSFPWIIYVNIIYPAVVTRLNAAIRPGLKMIWIGGYLL